MRYRLGIPPAGRNCDVVGRRIGRRDFELSQFICCSGELRGVHLRCDLVALLGRVRVALSRGEREPQPRLAKVLFNSEAARVKHGEIVLAVANAQFCSFAKPLRRFDVVRLVVDRLGVHHGQIVRSPGVPGFRRLGVPTLGLGGVPRHPYSLLIEGADPELCRRETGRGRTLKPKGRRMLVLRDSTAFEQSLPQFILRARRAFDDSIAQALRQSGRNRGDQFR